MNRIIVECDFRFPAVKPLYFAFAQPLNNFTTTRVLLEKKDGEYHCLLQDYTHEDNLAPTSAAKIGIIGQFLPISSLVRVKKIHPGPGLLKKFPIHTQHHAPAHDPHIHDPHMWFDLRGRPRPAATSS